MAEDEFFEEETDFANRREGSAKPAAPVSPKAAPPKAAKAKAAPQGGANPPSFLTVVAIALVALVLGIGIGYFIAMAVVDRTGGAQAPQEAPATTQAQAGGEGQASAPAGADYESGSMPEGHPDLSTMINEDGSINEEAVAQYRAERAAQSAGEGEGAADEEPAPLPMDDVDDAAVASGVMPEGHPDLSTMINEDGSINEEAVAQYRAERAAAGGSGDASE